VAIFGDASGLFFENDDSAHPPPWGKKTQRLTVLSPSLLESDITD
jgi:hypothetical protein